MALFVALQVMDIETTMLVFSLGGYEANPFMQLFVQMNPLIALVLWKVIAVGLFTGLVRYRPAGIIKVQAFYSIVIAWNLLVIALGSPAA